jgi:hypothetical protein
MRSEPVKYLLNVNTGVEHELTENQVADLKGMGFEVTEAGGKKADDKTTTKSTEKKEA